MDNRSRDQQELSQVEGAVELADFELFTAKRFCHLCLHVEHAHIPVYMYVFVLELQWQLLQKMSVFVRGNLKATRSHLFHCLKFGSPISTRPTSGLCRVNPLNCCSLVPFQLKSRPIRNEFHPSFVDPEQRSPTRLTLEKFALKSKNISI